MLSCVVYLSHCAFRAVISLFFICLCLIRSSISFLPESAAAIVNSALNCFSVVKRGVNTLINWSTFYFLSVVMFLQLVYLCFCALKSVLYGLISQCLSVLTTGSFKRNELQKPASGNGAKTVSTATFVVPVATKPGVIMSLINTCLVLVFLFFHLACVVKRFCFHVVKTGSNILRRVVILCFRDLKSGRDSEILQTSATCYQLLKTACSALLYILFLCFHLLVTAGRELVRYVKCSIFGSKSVNAVKTTACVMSDSAFCSHNH